MLALTLATSFSLTLALTDRPSASAVAANPKHHRVVFQVNSADPEAMKHAIANSLNAKKYYDERGETLDIEIVAYGAGVHMFRDDTSPVKDLLGHMRKLAPAAKFTVCGNTKHIMENREGRAMPLVENANVVPAGIVRLIELQEAGWSYARP